MKIKQSILILTYTLISTSLIAGGGWAHKKGKGYFKLSQSAIRAGQYFNPNGDLIDITTTSVYMTILYGEYGISDRFTGLISAPLFVRSTINNRQSSINDVVIPGDSFNGFGDLELGIKYGIIQDGPVVLAATLVLHFPTGDNVGGETELLQTGDGAFSQMIALEASHSFYPNPFYVTLSTAFNHRGTTTYSYRLGDDEVNYSDEFRWGGEFGWTPGSHWLINLKWLQVISLNNGNNGGETGSSSIFGNNVEYFSITPEANYIFANKLGISAAVGAALSGRNILASPNFSLGMFYTW
jgi:hypothetical protein